jgi:hypothetical protein
MNVGGQRRKGQQNRVIAMAQPGAIWNTCNDMVFYRWIASLRCARNDVGCYLYAIVSLKGEKFFAPTSAPSVKGGQTPPPTFVPSCFIFFPFPPIPRRNPTYFSLHSLFIPPKYTQNHPLIPLFSPSKKITHNL